MGVRTEAFLLRQQKAREVVIGEGFVELLATSSTFRRDNWGGLKIDKHKNAFSWKSNTK